MPDEDPIRSGPQSPTPTVRELAMVLFRQRRVFVWVSGVVLAAAAIYAFAGTKYEAKMKIMVRRGRADAPVSAQENAPVDLTRMTVAEEDLNSEVELLRDDEVLHKVVIETGSGGRDWFYFLHWNETPAERVERLARRLGKKLQVEPAKKTNLIAVSYASGNPQRAARVLQAVANAYLEKHTVVHRPSGEFRFFDQQKSESRLQLEEAKGKLLSFASRHGVVSAAQQRDLALVKLSEMGANLRQTRIEIAETGQRVAELEAQLGKLPERTTTQVRIADNPELMKALKSDLLDLQLKKTQLLTKFEPTHRLVQEVEQQIQQTEAAIAAENLLPLRDEITDKNVRYEWAKAELQSAQVQLKALKARETATAAQEIAYRTMARQLAEDAITQDELVSTEKAAQESYLLYVKKQEEARMDDALDERGIVNVALVEQPMAPALPVWSAWMVLAAGIVAAGATGTGAAFVADYFDPAFRSPDDVLTYLNAPVLASLPRKTSGGLSA
jgi:succinoglycan biosynthesis transport protein ExoP